jgi:hypothetical protein
MRYWVIFNTHSLPVGRHAFLSPSKYSWIYYSDNCFGTADCIAFRRGVLRIHDLKTGSLIASEHQLEAYAALFCLEYQIKPFEIEIELRIYQNDEVRIYEADPDLIFHIMDKIITFDRRINSIRQEVAQ